MAELVLGIGTSHTPLLALDGPEWLEWGKNDHTSHLLFDEDGQRISYDDRVAALGDRFADTITVERCIEAKERSTRALDALAARIVQARLDTIVVVGDDQYEHLLDNNLPAIVVYWGDSIRNSSLASVGDRAPIVQRSLSGYLEEGPDREYPVDSAFARHLMGVMLDRHIDLASAHSLPNPTRGMGHAFAFPLRRLIPEGTPIVPVMVNTYNPPSQPRVQRCVEYGRAIREAIDAYGRGRIGVLASGGLSHFLVLEEVDQRFLQGFAKNDLEVLTSIPETMYQAGTSEVKNWIIAAAACTDKDFDLLDYIPAYRTLAGSGTGLAFGTWS